MRLPSNGRDQVSAVVALLALIGVGAFWHFVYVPAEAALSRRIGHLDFLIAQNQQDNAQVTHPSLEALRAQARQLDTALARMQPGVLEARDLSPLLERIAVVARRVGVHVDAIEPEPVQHVESFDVYRYKVRVTGSYHEIGGLLTGIASLMQIVAPLGVQLQLASAASGTSRNAKRPTSRVMLNGNFVMQTFVLPSAPRPRSHRESRSPSVARQYSLPREVFAYVSSGRRDPFLSPIETGELRPFISDLRVIGVLYDPTGKHSVAVLHDQQTKQQYRMAVGRVVGRVLVSAINARTVVVTLQERGVSRPETLMVNTRSTQDAKR